MSAETLRLAATKLRAAAVAATEGPWESTYGPREVGRVWTHDDDYSPLAEMVRGGAPFEQTAHDAAYISMMNPLVGLLLAKWLEAESVEMDYGGTYTEYSQEIARLILGETQ